MIPTSAPAGRGRMNGVPLPFGPRAPSSLRRHHDVKPRPPARPSTATATPRQAKSPAREITITLSAMSCAATTTMPRRRRSDASASSETTPAGGGDATTTTGGSSGPAQCPGAGATHADRCQPRRGDGDGRHGQAGEGGRRRREPVRSAGLGGKPAVELAGQVDHGARGFLEPACTGLRQHDRAEPPAAQGRSRLSLLLACPEERVDVGDVLGAREGAALGLGVIDGRGEGCRREDVVGVLGDAHGRREARLRVGPRPHGGVGPIVQERHDLRVDAHRAGDLVHPREGQGCVSPNPGAGSVGSVASSSGSGGLALSPEPVLPASRSGAPPARSI